jgi:CRISPR/Cas system Type II protein with McrA/HNH and RuvC-like nuclease domain
MVDKNRDCDSYIKLIQLQQEYIELLCERASLTDAFASLQGLDDDQNSVLKAQKLRDDMAKIKKHLGL